MIPLTSASIFISLAFGIIAIWLSTKEEKTKKMLLEAQGKYKKQLFGISLLKEIQERISYELDVSKIADVIMENLQNLLPYSVIAFLAYQNNKIVLTIRISENVGQKFLAEAKINMLTFLSSLVNKPIPGVSEEHIQGIVQKDNNDAAISSMFHVPMTINNNVTGVLSIFSTKPNLYREEDIYLLEQIVMQASNALSKLHEVLTVEQGKLLAMVGSLTDGVFMVTSNNQVVAMNNAAKMLLGIRKDNPTLFDIVNVFPQGFDLVNKMRDILAHNKSLRTSKLLIGDRTIKVYITPVTKLSSAGSLEKEVIGAAVLIHDTTIEENLEKVKEDITNIIVHELRAPLFAIKSASELIIKSEEKFDKEERTKMLSIIHEQSQKLLSQVSSLLDVAKLKAGKFAIEKSQESIKDIISQSVSIFAPQAKTRNIRLTTHIDETLPLVFLDKTRIGEVINNLLSNSLKFTPTGGAITIETHQDNTNVTVSVSDTGIGIPEEKQSDLFTKFSQIGTPSSHMQPILGTGLGLYIVKGIIEAHGGYVTLHSKPNQGTTISFSLPLKSEVKQEKPQEKEKTIPFSTIGTSIN